MATPPERTRLAHLALPVILTALAGVAVGSQAERAVCHARFGSSRSVANGARRTAIRLDGGRKAAIAGFPPVGVTNVDFDGCEDTLRESIPPPLLAPEAPRGLRVATEPDLGCADPVTPGVPLALPLTSISRRGPPSL